MKVSETITDVIQELTPYVTHAKDKSIHLTPDEKQTLMQGGGGNNLSGPYYVHQYLSSRNVWNNERRRWNGEYECKVNIAIEGTLGASIPGACVVPKNTTSAQTYITPAIVAALSQHENCDVIFHAGVYVFDKVGSQNVGYSVGFDYSSISANGDVTFKLKDGVNAKEGEDMAFVNFISNATVISGIKFDGNKQNNAKCKVIGLRIDGRKCIVENCSFVNCDIGIDSVESGAEVLANKISGGSCGIRIGTLFSSDERIMENYINACGAAILAQGGKNAIVAGNVIKGCDKSIYITESTDMMVCNNASDKPIEIMEPNTRLKLEY